jgi:hypothetical protein
MPERNRPGVNSTHMLLLLLVCVRPTAVKQQQKSPEMVDNGITKATAAAEVLCAAMQPLPLGVEVAARRPWFWSFLMDLVCRKLAMTQI